MNSTASNAYTLVTGVTGLVGRYLLRDLLSAGKRLAVVVRDGRKQSAAQRVESIMQHWERDAGQPLPRPIVFSGDVSQPGMGLDAEQTGWLRRHCNSVLHNAAILKFQGADRNGDPWKTNLDGTKHVLDVCRDVQASHMHYVSSAYVCGNRVTTVYENELDCGQAFRNDYEHSKFLAEKCVRDCDLFESTTIYRPAVIAGDTKTGYTSTYHGLFLYLRLLAMLVPAQEAGKDGAKLTDISLPYQGDEPRNVVPVDWVASVICKLFDDTSAHGNTFHLAPDQYITARQIIDFCCEYFGSYGVQYAGGNEEERKADESEFAAKFFENTAVYSSYETTDPKFDCTNLKKFAGDLPCPAIDNEVVRRYLEFGIQDQWGKRREAKPSEPGLSKLHLDRFADAAAEFVHLVSTPADNGHVRFGVDAFGVGGGQWSFCGSADQGFEYERGLPPAAHHVFQCDVETLERMLSEGCSKTRNDELLKFVTGAATASPHFG